MNPLNLIPIAIGLVLLLIDWRQTREILKPGDDITETNTVIVWAHKRWGDSGVRWYFLAAAVLVVAVWTLDLWLPLGEGPRAARLVVTGIWFFRQWTWCASNKGLLRRR